MIVTGLITVLCGVGLYASLFMLRKARLAEAGALSEPSVVQSPRARLVGGLPNGLLGAVYYPLLAVAVWLPLPNAAVAAVCCAVAAAALTSLYLAYSLLFVTRRPCVYCWTSHAINWSLVLLVALRYWLGGHLL